VANKNIEIGQDVLSYKFTVETGKIREFVQAIGDTNPVYVNCDVAKAHGYKDIVAPPTFGILMDMWGGNMFEAMCQSLGLQAVKTLHGGQEYNYFDEINPGDVITAHMRVSSVSEKESMNIINLDTDYINQYGKKVLQCRETTIEMK
jgi:acyl dehydratase